MGPKVSNSSPTPEIKPVQEQSSPAQQDTVHASASAMSVGGPVALEAETPSEDLIGAFASEIRSSGDSQGSAEPGSVFEAVYANYTQEQWENLPDYMRRGTKERPEVLGMDGDTLAFAPIVFKHKN